MSTPQPREIGAPQAIQVADRWHLLANLVEALTHLLARHRRQVSMVAAKAEDGPARAEEGRAATIEASHSPAVSASLTERQGQDAYVQMLHQHGLPPSQIASRMDISERTMYRWLARGAAPHGRHHTRGRSVIDPYKASVLKRWQDGSRKGSQMCQELKALGYRGSERAVYRYLTFLQAPLLPAAQTTMSRAAGPEPFSAKQAVWLLIRQPEELTEHQRQELLRLCQASSQIAKAYQLAQSFRGMLRLRQGEERLDGWLQEVSSSDLPALQQFAAGIQRDKAAVQAGLSLPYSTGPVEGHINRLQLIKRESGMAGPTLICCVYVCFWLPDSRKLRENQLCCQCCRREISNLLHTPMRAARDIEILVVVPSHPFGPYPGASQGSRGQDRGHSISRVGLSRAANPRELVCLEAGVSLTCGHRR